jgi:hypothetical protein
MIMDQLKNDLNRLKKQAESRIEDFKARLNEDPLDPFNWGMETIEAAATLRMVSIVQNQIEKDVSFAHIVKYALDQSLIYSRSPKKIFISPE